MTLQQLKYVIQVAQVGSINLASQKLFISQPSLSNAIAELEKEMGITLFSRTSRGVCLTEDGTKFLSYARQVVENADLLESKYKHSMQIRREFAISSQHYAFVVNAFVSLVKEYDKNQYEFSLRETRTYDIIEDVRTGRSELGILFLSKFNTDVLMALIKKSDLKFTKLFNAQPHVFISRNNPLAKKKSITLDDLQNYPRLTYEQGINNSFYFSEELHSTVESQKSIVVSDRATLFNLLIGLNGYTICSGILSSDLNGDNIIALPLESNEEMQVGYIAQEGRQIGQLAVRYLELLEDYIANCNR
jgi:DNA-binding transcriptional LysR family regulator